MLTLHRPDNVDEAEPFRSRPRRRRADQSLRPGRLSGSPTDAPAARGDRSRPGARARAGHHHLSPLGYLDFVGLVGDAALVLTDSGGIQEETTVLGVPCLTLRESTERPVTVTSGTNCVVGTDTELIVEEALVTLEGTRPPARIPELWDGRAGERIVDRLYAELNAGFAASLGTG